ncbi:hypothetical protein B0H21DRAFT_248988 [Amylocystis lapponica]|nr:hypothetical protein B0H21DRAFT_248988 [Amylocystis lapponica]
MDILSFAMAAHALVAARLRPFIAPISTATPPISPTPTLVQVTSEGDICSALFIVVLIMALSSLGLLASCTRSRAMVMTFLVTFSITQASVTPIAVHGFNILQVAVSDVNLSIFVRGILADTAPGLWLSILLILDSILRWVLRPLWLFMEKILHVIICTFLGCVCLLNIFLFIVVWNDCIQPHLTRTVKKLGRVLCAAYCVSVEWSEKWLTGVLHAMYDVRRTSVFLLRRRHVSHFFAFSFGVPTWVIRRNALEIILRDPMFVVRADPLKLVSITLWHEYIWLLYDTPNLYAHVQYAEVEVTIIPHGNVFVFFVYQIDHVDASDKFSREPEPEPESGLSCGSSVVSPLLSESNYGYSYHWPIDLTGNWYSESDTASNMSDDLALLTDECSEYDEAWIRGPDDTESESDFDEG